MKWFDMLVEALRTCGEEYGEWSLMSKDVHGVHVHLAKVVKSPDGIAITVYNVNAVGLFETKLCGKLNIECTNKTLMALDVHDEDVQNAAWEVLEESFKVVEFDDN